MSSEELAQLLWSARRDGTVVDAESVALPQSLGEAYAVQERMTKLSGARRVGFKIGSTSREAQRLLGTTEPGAAPLLDAFVFASPARIAISPLHMPAVEGEFAFRLATALPARASPYTRDEVAAAFDAVSGAIEIVGTRFAGGLAGKGRLLTTADGGVNIALAHGVWRPAWRDLDLPAHRVAMRINGKPAGEGTGARALDDPVNVLVWLSNHQSQRGCGLDAGTIVSTGTCTGLDAVRPGDVAEADFGILGVVRITFTDQTR